MAMGIGAMLQGFGGSCDCSGDGVVVGGGSTVPRTCMNMLIF